MRNVFILSLCISFISSCENDAGSQARDDNTDSGNDSLSTEDTSTGDDDPESFGCREGAKKFVLCEPDYFNIVDTNEIKKKVECKNGEWVDVTPCFEGFKKSYKEQKAGNEEIGWISTYNYNDNWVLLTKKIETTSGTLLRNVFYDYDDKGGLELVTENNKEEKPMKIVRYVLKYNGHGKVAERLEHTTDYGQDEKNTGSYIAEYYENDNIKNIRVRDFIWSIDYYYYYNEDGIITRYEIKSPASLIESDFDAEKNEEIFQLRDGGGLLVATEFIEFNNEGQEEKITVTNYKDELLYTWVLEVDDLDHKEWTQYDSKNFAIGSQLADFDENGNIIVFDVDAKSFNNEYDLEQFAIRKEYKYDEKGFMIESNDPSKEMQLEFWEYYHVER